MSKQYRASPTRSGFKVEELIPQCSHCGTGSHQWKTLLYTYPLMDRARAEIVAEGVADALNRSVEEVTERVKETSRE